MCVYYCRTVCLLLQDLCAVIYQCLTNEDLPTYSTNSSRPTSHGRRPSSGDAVPGAWPVAVATGPARERWASRSSETTKPMGLLDDAEAGEAGGLVQAAHLNQQPLVVHPPSNPEEPFVVDALDFAAGRCTPFVDLDTVAGRLATFRTRWRVTSDGVVVSFPERRLRPLNPKMLAKAGFLYCPDAQHTDRCMCFCCNLNPIP